MVAMVVQLLPVITETSAQITHTARRNSLGVSTLSPPLIIIGTIPLIIQLPEIIPISRRISTALPMERMLSSMAVSRLCQEFLHTSIDTAMPSPAARISASWLAPSIASAPKKRTTKNSSTIRNTIGASEAQTEGCFISRTQVQSHVSGTAHR